MVNWAESLVLMLLAINNEKHTKEREREGKNSSTTVHNYVCISLCNEIYKNLSREPDAHTSNMRTKNIHSERNEGLNDK